MAWLDIFILWAEAMRGTKGRIRQIVLVCVLAAGAVVNAAEKPIWIHPLHVGPVTDSAFTTNFYITTAYSGLVKVWDAKTFEFSHLIFTHLEAPAMSKRACSGRIVCKAHSLKIRGEVSGERVANRYE